MKLLLDENLSRRLVPFLQHAFPGSTQITLLSMEAASDIEIWNYARLHDFVIVTKDADFYDLSCVFGQPPKLIWLKIGNQSKSLTINRLTTNQTFIERALLIDNMACVEIY